MKKTEWWYKDLSGEIEKNMQVISKDFDKEYTGFIIEQLVRNINERYFRPEFVGFDSFPERNNPEKPLIFASNHSGMAFPWDAMILVSEMYRKFNFGPQSMRPLATPVLSESRIMNPFLYDNLWRKVGSVNASFLNFETMMHQKDHNLLIYPEGVNGIGKGFNRKYQLQRFSSSFITLSIKYQTDIIPVLTVNGEYINPFAYNIKWLNNLVKGVGIPFLPVSPLSIFMPLQPWIFYAALPAKLTYVLGERISPYKMTDKSVEDLEYEELLDIKERVKQLMQQQLNKAVEGHGQEPYKIREFLKLSMKKPIRTLFALPYCWALLYNAKNVQWEDKAAPSSTFFRKIWSTLNSIFRKPYVLFFYIPVIGWLPILWMGLFRKRSKEDIAQRIAHRAQSMEMQQHKV